MFCAKCGCKLSEDAKFCQNCGSPIQRNVEQVPPIKTVKTILKKILFIVIPFILIVLFVGIVMKFGRTESEKELEVVENLFSLNYNEILSEYPNAKEHFPDSNSRDKGLYIESTFAEVKGEYYVYIYDGYVKKVVFEPQNEDADGIKIAEALNVSLGKYEEYDSERGFYVWKTKNLEIKCYIEERTYFEWIGEDFRNK